MCLSATRLAERNGSIKHAIVMFENSGSSTMATCCTESGGTGVKNELIVVFWHMCVVFCNTQGFKTRQSLVTSGKKTRQVEQDRKPANRFLNKKNKYRSTVITGELNRIIRRLVV